MRRALLDEVIAARRDRKPVALVTELDTGLQCLVSEATIAGQFGLVPEDLAAVRAALSADRSLIHDQRLFIVSYAPPPRLLLVGAVHIAQALAPLAGVAGYGVTVIDPRRAFASDDRFPAIAVDRRWPDEALAALAPDARSAIVTLTHDPKLDDPALSAALGSTAFYIGALGSKKTHASRLERLREAGFDQAQLARIHGPVGLPLGAVGQAEIALSILAEITAVRRLGRSVGR